MVDTLFRGLQLAAAVKRLQTGLAQAERPGAYLGGEGFEALAEVADVVRPGAGRVAIGLRERARELAGQHGLVAVEGEFRELGTPPWEPFKRHWLALPSGGNLFLGPIGQGKTTLMNHLAARLVAQHGFATEYVSIYEDDRILSGDELSPEKLATRVARIVLSLNPGAADDEDFDPNDEDAAVTRKASTEWRKFLERVRGRFGIESIYDLRRIFGGRLILVDEAGTDALGGNPNDPYRQAIVRSLDQCRHVRWHLLMVSQRARSIPKDPISASTVWIKQPTGRELALDTGNNRVLRDLWESATAGFAELRQHPYWPLFPDPRSWAWVDSPPRDRWRGWRGMVPFTPGAAVATQPDTHPAGAPAAPALRILA